MLYGLCVTAIMPVRLHNRGGNSTADTFAAQPSDFRKRNANIRQFVVDERSVSHPTVEVQHYANAPIALFRTEKRIIVVVVVARDR